jgi:hypothetical protein
MISAKLKAARMVIITGKGGSPVYTDETLMLQNFQSRQSEQNGEA